MKIAISGANGQLGQELHVLASANKELDFIFLTRHEFDLSQPATLEEKLLTLAPDYFINCAAYTAVDKAESEKELAFTINAEAPAVIAAVSKKINCRLIHVSTDYVFDGKAGRPYLETDTTAPVTVYGSSKEQGEREVMRQNNDAVIVRTSWVYSGFGKNFLLTMLRLFGDKPTLNVVADQVGTPTNAADLAAALLQIVSSNLWFPGIYHYSNEGVASWFDFATEIARIAGSSCVIKPITTAEYPTPAHRPAYSVLDKQKIKDIYNIRILPWKDSLAACMEKIKKARQ